MSTTVFFATNRQPLLDPTDPSHQAIVGFGSELGPTGGLDVRYGSVKIDVDLAAGSARLKEGSLNVASQKLLFPSGGAPTLGSTTIFDAIRQSMKEDNCPTIAFIHGFSNTFVDAVERAGWILEFFGLKANIFAFSWPSIGSVLPIPTPYGDYTHDRRTAAASGMAIARTIQRLADFVDGLAREERCDQSIHLLCHSMGNYAMRNALQALMGINATAAADTVASSDPATLSPPLRRYFDKIILAAADEDADAFDDPAKFKFLPRIGRSVTVYHTEKDWVLGTLSDVTKFNGPRLGSDGPDNMASISDKVSAIDVSDVISATKDIESHQYYRTFPAVRDDIVAVLKGGKPEQIANRKPVSSARWRLTKAAAKPVRAKRP